MSITFFDSPACRRRLACADCRGSRVFRESVAANYGGPVDFACPIDLPIGPTVAISLLNARTRRRLELCDACPHQRLMEATCDYPEGAPSCDRIRGGAGRPCRPEFELQLRSGDGPAGCPWKELRPPFE